MTAFNSSTNTTVNLGPNDTLQVAGLALLRVNPAGATPFETTNIGEVQTYGPYKAPTSIQLLGLGFGNFYGATVAVKEFMPIAIFGKPNVGQTLTAVVAAGWQSNGGNWTRDGANISNANGLTYALVDADFSHAVTYVSSSLAYVPPVLVIGVSLAYFAPAPSPAPAPVFTAQSAPGGTVGTVYNYTFAASNATSFATTSGAVPAGLTLASSGQLSGTPTTAATSAFTVTATGSGGSTSSNAQSVVMAAAAPDPTPAPAPADTRPRFGYAPANAAGDQTAFGNLFGTMTPMTGSANAGRSGTFNTTSSTVNYTWIAVLHSAAPGGIRIFDGTGYGGFSGAQTTGIYGGADSDPMTIHGTFTNTDGNVYDLYRSNGKASTFSTFTLS